MANELREIIERVKAWPAWRQADAAHMLEAMEKGGTEVYRLTDQERELLDEALEQANREIFVSDEDMEKFWNRHRV